MVLDVSSFYTLAEFYLLMACIILESNKLFNADSVIQSLIKLIV